MNQPSYFDEYEQRLEQDRRQALATFTGTIASLEAMGITRIVIGYDGYGDEGAVEPPVAYRGEKTVELPQNLAETLADAAMTLAPDGFENNAGAYGDFVLEVGDRKLIRNHNWRVDAIESGMEEYSL